MTFAELLKDRFLAADPGQTRLNMALRATASVATALALLVFAAHRWHVPLSVPLIGAALCMSWSISVADADPVAQRITTVLMWLPCEAAVVAGTLTAHLRVVSDVLFLCVLFAAVYVRRLGPRANALGMIAVIAFFFALFLRADPRTLPWLVLATTISGVCTYFYRFVVFRDDPQRAMRSALDAFAARQRLVADTMAHAQRAGGWNERLRRRVNGHLYRLNEAAIAIDDLLEPDASDARAAVLDAEQRTAIAVRRSMQGRWEPVHFLAPVIPAAAVRPHDWTPRGAYRVGTQIEMRVLHPSARQAIQLTAAASVAIVAGELLSPQRWYWAVLTAFLVFSGTSSSGEAIAKGWSRVFGTGFGIAAGAGIAALIRGNDPLALALLFVFLFAGVYAIRISYATFTVFLTALLSLLYVLIGAFSDSLLVLRLVETAIGAACGGIAALVLLPIRTRDVLGNVSGEALERLADAIEASIRRLDGDLTADPLVRARAYDEAMQSVRSQIDPLLTTALPNSAEPLHARLLIFRALGEYAHGLASVAHERPDDCPFEEIDPLAGQIVQEARTLAGALRGQSLALDDAPALQTRTSSVLEYLDRIHRSLHHLARVALPAPGER